jgi:hypothetical protein
VEDGSVERLLIAEPIQPQLIPDLIQKSDASRGYSIGRHWNRLWNSDVVPTSDQLPDLIGRSVNLLCRACLTIPQVSNDLDSTTSSDLSTTSLTIGRNNRAFEHTYELLSNPTLFDLLFGEQQIVTTFAAALHDGFRCKTSRYSFRPSEHLWDMLLKVQPDSEPIDVSDRRLTTIISKLLQRIAEQAVTLGKEDRVRLLILLCIRERALPTLFRTILQSRCLSLYYEPTAFLRQSSSAHFLDQVLGPLDDIQLQLPPDITKGI